MTPATKRRIAKDYENNNSYAVGERWGISPTHVLRIVRAQGGEVRTSAESLRNNHQLSPTTVKAMVRMYEKGKRPGGLPIRLVDIADRYVLSITKVRRVLLSEGVKIRTRGSRRKKGKK